MRRHSESTSTEALGEQRALQGSVVGEPLSWVPVRRSAKRFWKTVMHRCILPPPKHQRTPIANLVLGCPMARSMFDTVRPEFHDRNLLKGLA